MPTIDARGETLHYVREGAGPHLVLVHSLGTGAWLWEEQIRRWSADFDVIAFDLRGHGKSTNHGGVTLRDIARDLHAALARLDALPAHFVGISMGGPILGHLHDLAPEAFLSLVIADSFATQGEPGKERAKMLEKRIRGTAMPDYGQAYADETILPDSPRTAHQALASAIGEMEMETYLQTVRSVFTADVRDHLAKVRVPTFVVVGEKDNRTPPALSQAIVDLIPGATMSIIPGAAHLANLDNPDGFDAAVTPFLRASAKAHSEGAL